MTTNRVTKLTRQLPFLALLIVGGIAIAQSANSGRDIPYVGYLDENGVPVNGARDVKIGLFSQQGGTACHEFEESVDFLEGRFQVDFVDLPADCFATGDLFASFAVESVDLATPAGVFFAPITTVSHAPGPFTVNGDLDVKGDVLIDKWQTSYMSRMGPLGSLGQTFNFTSNGGTLQFALSASSYASSVGTVGIMLQLDGEDVIWTDMYASQTGVNFAHPTKTYFAKVPAGAHQIRWKHNTPRTVTTSNNEFVVYVTELPW